jgi:hypothetical protein
MDRSLVDQASKILGETFDPSKYLLSHATIVASVDTIVVPNVRLGAGTADGKPVNRKTTAFRIKPGCEQYINNNDDSWARPVLMKSYKTFIGGHNFLEHVQIEDLSKGRILDAVARDIGDSIYTDILIATSRKHLELIKDIESGKLATLSMGCSIDGSTCTKCGHWAADETEFCDHIKYMKGNTFFDERGVKHRIAELCGDESLDPTGGVQFIEASWVEVPAFKGAVARNIITLSSDDNSKTAQRLVSVMATPAPAIPEGGYQKAARMVGGAVSDPEIRFRGAPPRTTMPVVAFDDGMGDEGGGGEETPAPKEPPDPLKDLKEEVKKQILDDVKRELKEELAKNKLAPSLLPAGASAAPNDTVVKQAMQRRAAYLSRIQRIVQGAKSDREVIWKIARLNRTCSIFVPDSLYIVALKVGSSRKYGSLPLFLSKCKEQLGRAPTAVEAKTLIRLAKLLASRSSRAA